MFVQLADIPAMGAHLSPPEECHKAVNVIGMDLVGQQLQNTIFGLDREFEHNFMTHKRM
jgi:hypothetical protein